MQPPMPQQDPYPYTPTAQPAPSDVPNVPNPQYQQPYQPQYQPYQTQQPFQQQQMAPQPMPIGQIPPPPPTYMQQNVNVNIQTGKQHGFLSRALYFCFIGWWAGLIWMHIGFALCALIVTLPLGLAMLNRLPGVITLRPSSGNNTNVNVAMASVQNNMAAPGTMQTINININTGNNKQNSFLVRALYYCFIGWWAGYLWALIGYACVCSIVLLPVGLMMLNRLPAVLTLRKN